MDWTEDAIATLRQLWSEGLSTAEIGRRMGISKNAVVGKAHRLNLAARPSPIRRVPGATPSPRPARRAARPAMPRPSPMMAGTPMAARPPAERPAPVVPMRPAPQPLRLGNSACCWPLGDPGTPGFRFCGAQALLGKPYCAEHASVAYVRVKDRREDAA
ncbi:GcrA family cell cycle regulator [Elioraea tepidiphila]|jgi:GcrA cell cycle regulator|uniref:GcrA family cell cycle regulator n=1 Tax=Elioraea tepidiphila TaxID=457934 RepID=UPI00037B8FAE|nr:GcrA family cell cycle regulator [Elioraea tepidiphila]